MRLPIFTQHEQERNVFYKNQYSIPMNTNRTLQASLCGCLVYAKLSVGRRGPTADRPTLGWGGWMGREDGEEGSGDKDNDDWSKY